MKFEHCMEQIEDLKKLFGDSFNALMETDPE